MTRTFVVLAGAALGFAATAATAAIDSISGAGATFPYPIYAKWADAYKKTTGISLNYQSIGSGGGIKQIKARTVDFGASDAPLKPEELEAAGLMQFPMVIGGVVPVVHLEGVGAGALRLTGGVLADIYLGKITQWNDPAIAALNPKVKLPGQYITPVHRSDGSGTTWIFTNYLTKVSADWKEKVGNNTSVQWPAGVGGKGNEGVANYTQQINGAIGYVEYAYALQNKMDYALLQNAAGKFVKPDSKTFQAAAANADWAHAPGFYQILTQQPGDESWPITGATFILVYKNPDDAARVAEVLKFFDWAYAHGDQMAEELDYIPMPDNVVKLVHKAWSDQVQTGGKPVYAAKD